MLQAIERFASPTTTRNPGIPLDLGWVESVRVNRSAVERRTQSLPLRRSIKKEWQAGWLLRAITCLDLTALAGDDTPGNVRRLCAKGARPLSDDIRDGLQLGNLPVTVAAICVYHNLVPIAVSALSGTQIPVAAVSTGFPAGQISVEQKLAEIGSSIQAGAAEIDIVISRAHVIRGNWHALYDEVRSFRHACGESHLKTILATGELPTLGHVGMASLVCMMAGADYIKTSTGKESVNAVLPVGLVMARAIRDYRERTGHRVGFKPAGGIRTARQALEWQVLMKEELGNEWLQPRLFRLGASGLLTDIERQLHHFCTGHYAARHHFPMP